MSATGNFNTLSHFFGDYGPTFGSVKSDKALHLPAIEAYTRTIHYEDYPVPNLLHWIRDKLVMRLDRGLKGHVLVFVESQDAVHETIQYLQDLIKSYDSQYLIKLLPFFRDLDRQEQQEIFTPTTATTTTTSTSTIPTKRTTSDKPSASTTTITPTKETVKIIISTNLAETSITIDGCSVVLDTCYSKDTSYDPLADASRLLKSPCSKASSTQRAGRTARTCDGDVYRACTKETWDSLDEFIQPGILRDDNADVMFVRAAVLRQAQKLDSTYDRMLPLPGMLASFSLRGYLTWLTLQTSPPYTNTYEPLLP